MTTSRNHLEQAFLEAVKKLPKEITPQEVDEIYAFVNAGKTWDKFMTYVGYAVAATIVVATTHNMTSLATMAQDWDKSIGLIGVAGFLAKQIPGEGEFSREKTAIRHRLLFDTDPNANTDQRFFSLKYFIRKALGATPLLGTISKNIINAQDQETILAKAKTKLLSSAANWLNTNVIDLKNKVNTKLTHYRAVADLDQETIYNYYKAERKIAKEEGELLEKEQGERTQYFIDTDPLSNIETISQFLKESAPAKHQNPSV